MRQQRLHKINEARQAATLAPKNYLTTPEIDYLKEKGFDPKMPFNVIRTIIRGPDDHAEAVKVSAILSKLPKQTFHHIIIEIIKTK